jgi:hypothetical protein
MPPDWIAAPEQIIADEVITYDIYSADVYCLGRTLKCELDQAMEYYQGQSVRLLSDSSRSLMEICLITFDAEYGIGDA